MRSLTFLDGRTEGEQYHIHPELSTRPVGQRDDPRSLTVLG